MWRKKQRRDTLWRKKQRRDTRNKKQTVAAQEKARGVRKARRSKRCALGRREISDTRHVTAQRLPWLSHPSPSAALAPC